MVSQQKIRIALAGDLFLDIYPEQENSLFEITEEDAEEFSESRYQILEGRSYEYAFSDNSFRLITSNTKVITQLRREASAGRIIPNIYVGTLTLQYFHKNTPDNKENLTIEVLATKFNREPDKSYRENYRFMLESITSKCTELLMQVNSPIHQNFEPDFERDNEIIYQRFCFVSALISSNEFDEAVRQIISQPKTSWAENVEVKEVTRVRRFNRAITKQLLSGNNRIPLREQHYLLSRNISSVPSKILASSKIEKLDNAENRFIKHALQEYLSFCENCSALFRQKTREKKEADVLIKVLESYLSHNFFKEISNPVTLKLNSPVLQRKGGYREILNSWLKYSLASKLIWRGGDDVYKAGKRDIATLYEYWLFFTLYDLFTKKFTLTKVTVENKPYSELIEMDKDGINLMVKAGKHTAIEGICNFENRNLNVKYSYNRSFSGGKKYDSKEGGSWTSTLRPDYTLTVWPSGLSERKAEADELIVHIHFDAKYKVAHFKVKTDESEDELNEEKEEERQGIYKNADLLKMHAYKDAIRRTGGAYILYPGSEKSEFRGFHEIIPGLGAFSINPSGESNGIRDLSDFVDNVISHLLDRASQRERLSNKVYEIHKERKADDNVLHESIPEYLAGTRIIPDETFVIVGYASSKERLDWFKDKGKYIFRMDEELGSLILDNDVVNAKYLLIRKSNKVTDADLYRITGRGPKVYSKGKLESMKYPKTNSRELKEYYLSIDIEKVKDQSFENMTWDFKNLKKYIDIQRSNLNVYSKAGLPFTVTLTELLKVARKRAL
ncbi:MAG: hypothetical protein JWQ96_3136 [Segetibacter sp.]|nr:hypothetical protein [Segetibacter sp.]